MGRTKSTVGQTSKGKGKRARHEANSLESPSRRFRDEEKQRTYENIRNWFFIP